MFFFLSFFITDYGLFGSLEILAVVLVSLSLVTSFFSFIAFVTCFCRSLLRSDESKRLLESTDDFIYQQAGPSGPLPRTQSAEDLMERAPRTFPGGVPRSAELYPDSRPIQIIETSVDRDRQYLRRQPSLEDRARNVVYNENAAPVMDEETYRQMILSNFSWRLPRPQVQEPLVRSRSMESIVSFGDWDNFWLVQRVTDEESSQTTYSDRNRERVHLGIDPYEVLPADTLYMNEHRSRGDVDDRRTSRSHRRSRSLSPSGRSRLYQDDSSVSRDPLSPDEEYHVGRSRADYEQLANMHRTRDVPRFFLGGPSPTVQGSEV